MGNYIVLFVIGSLLSLNLFIIKVTGSCDLVDRIKHKDEGMNVTSTVTPCRMIVRSNDRRQVVVVVYNFRKNCIDANSTLTIEDGNLQNRTVINRACRAANISFISRKHELSIMLTPPSQPFDIDLHLIETEIRYNSLQGRITTPLYPGSDGGLTFTTPNNYHGRHTIESMYNVSMNVVFREFRVQPSPPEVAPSSCTRDSVKVFTDSSLRAEYCGDNVLPNPFNAVAREITLEYVTDDFTTYTGFTVEYNICQNEVKESSPAGAIAFPGFPAVKRTCMFIIKMTRQGKIQLDLEVSGNRNCSQVIMIIPDNKHSIPATCNGIQEVTAREVRIVFDLERDELLKGNYTIDYSSAEQVTSGNDDSSPFSDDETASATGVIVGIVVTVVFFIIVIVIGIIVYKRKKNKTNRKPSLRMDEIGENVYEDKKDYDHLNVKREHIKTPNDQNSNVYGRMIPSEVQDEYAVVNKGDKEPAEISANEYGAETFSTEYEETLKPTSEKKVIDDNVYE